jgi:hypothetical protein
MRKQASLSQSTVSSGCHLLRGYCIRVPSAATRQRGHDPEDHANCCGGVSRGRVPPDRLRIRTRGARDPRGQ